jgi:hypothetical protein
MTENKKLSRRRFLGYSALGMTGLAALPDRATAGNAPVELSENMTDIFQGQAAPQDHGKALINPGMGWVTYFYSNVFQHYGSQLEPSDTVRYFPGMNTVFLRLPWSFIEPEEGVFVWEILDTPAQRWVDAGGKVAFCITATENWMRSGTPQWVFDAGAKSYEVNGFLEPEYDDPVFLEKMENFIRIMAERYDGNSNVAYVFVGHYGMWGEGHTDLTTPKHGHSWGFDLQKKHIDIYRRHFKHTQLCISDDYVGHDTQGAHFPITDYAFSQGVSIHDDSILVNPQPKHWYHSEMAQLFWHTLPVVLEHQHYGTSVAKGAWNEELLLKSVEDYHASYLSIHWWTREFLEKNRDIIDRINRRIGYRLQMNAVQLPEKIKKGEKFTIQSQWSNAGVAPCYGGGYPCFTLKDEKSGIVSVLTDGSFNVKNLPVAPPENAIPVALTSTFIVAPVYTDSKGAFSRTCKPGTYDLFVSVGKMDGTPLYELPYEGNDGHKRYRMGKITIEN